MVDAALLGTNNVLTGMFVLLPLIFTVYQALRLVSDQVISLFMVKVHLDEKDELYVLITKWISHKPEMMTSRSLQAFVGHDPPWLGQEKRKVSVNNGHVNFAHLKFSKPIQYGLAIGAKICLIHEARRFWFHQVQIPGSLNGSAAKPKLIISCFGRSRDPIHRLLQHANDYFCQRRAGYTRILVPGQGSGVERWIDASMELIRPMESVVLPSEKKADLLSDLNNYLDPDTKKWFQNLGQPLRRGYLFHGPPGTGKTSLYLALAGYFTLDVYVVRGKISDSSLGNLFQMLQEHCVVVFEDIDSFGLVRTQDITKLPKRDSTDDGLTLSGLLNIIDGPGAAQGRTLILTTNNPQLLDEALTREGRVDVKVEFKNAVHTQIRDLFIWTFRDTLGRGQVPEERIADLAEDFAARLPDMAFSPAKISGFLSNYKKRPLDAITDVENWASTQVKPGNQQSQGRRTRSSGRV